MNRTPDPNVTNNTIHAAQYSDRYAQLTAYGISERDAQRIAGWDLPLSRLCVVLDNGRRDGIKPHQMCLWLGMAFEDIGTSETLEVAEWPSRRKAREMHEAEVRGETKSLRQVLQERGMHRFLEQPPTTQPSPSA